jgi:hypothetical protein
VTVSKCGAGTITTLLTGENRICYQLSRVIESNWRNLTVQQE